MTKGLPTVDIKKVFNDRFRYYQNVYTTSYSFVWWNWIQWEKHIDWMVMNAFNLVLTSSGQEAIWIEVYRELGLTQEDIDDHFTGPPFLSWLRMGNLRKWGGPLPTEWHLRSSIIQKAVIKRLRSFGVITVLPAFAGYLPRAFKRLYPEAKVVLLKPWNNFADNYTSLYFLDPTDYFFHEIGKMFMQKQIQQYGTDHVYSCDSFNENIPISDDANYLSNVSRAIYEAMKGADAQTIWLMQNSLFIDNEKYWTKDRAKALLTAIPLGRMIILDLQSEQHPKYFEMDQYFGQPYIWCMLHNYGGRLGMYGNSDIINMRPIQARNSSDSTMVGTGLTMEGINQNYVIYDLMIETAWTKLPVDLTDWFTNYTLRRYGHKNNEIIKTWTQLQKSLYNINSTICTKVHYAITSTPSWTLKPWIWEDTEKIYSAVDDFMSVSDENIKKSYIYKHDLIDMYRQCIQIFNGQLYVQMKYSFKRSKLHAFQVQSEMFLSMLEILDTILSLDKAFSLDEWVRSARAIGHTHKEKDWYEYNARNQITLWGPNGELMNYALKQWSGVVSDFILPRWRMFLKYSTDTLIKQIPFNETYIREKIFDKVEKPFTLKKFQYEKPIGDFYKTIDDCSARWISIIENLATVQKGSDITDPKFSGSSYRSLLRVVDFHDLDDDNM